MDIDFYGKDLPQEILEVKGIKIAPEHRMYEASLARKRWFDYRGLHPVTATYLYAHFYKEQTTKFYESVIDIRTVENARAFVPDDIFMSRDMTSMWLARSFADEHSLPYPFVLRFAQDRFFNRAQARFPRPNQLYGEEFEIDILPVWKETVARTLTYSRLERYRASNWQGDMAQAQHIAFVVKQIKERPKPRHKLLARLLKEDVLSAPMIASNFSQEELTLAEQHCLQFN